ncbi:peptidoglycan-binding protein [Streptomyces phaeochromogenes]|uniref:peptidoglycan-binding protein n=1 Tax=Streptomyces phaeochromogenes TaxID=1923 RepID=UPI00367448E5
MTVKIISRATWGAKPWNGTPAAVSLSRRTEFFVHYDGGSPITRTGYTIMRAIEAVHLGQGWSGVGYNFVVDQAGNAYEGRGWGLQGAHCPDHNITGLAVQIAVGGDQEPSAKALATARALYEEACKKTGRTLARRGHKDGFATACPGPKLYAWVKAGMPADDYEATPNPGGSIPGGGSGTELSRAQVTINGLVYGYGANGSHVTKVGKGLVKAGFGKFYSSGPGPVWTDADTLAYQAYQKSLGYSGADADGVPGETSLKKLLRVLPAKSTTAKPTPPFPGADKFGPGKSNASITLLGQQLVRAGYGKHYTAGPGPRWSDADRKNTRDFQLAHASLAGDADGIPGPQTWKLLFS